MEETWRTGDPELHYGAENLDIQYNFYKRILSCSSGLLNDVRLRNELAELDDYKGITVNEKLLKSLSSGIKEFEKEFIGLMKAQGKQVLDNFRAGKFEDADVEVVKKAATELAAKY